MLKEETHSNCVLLSKGKSESESLEEGSIRPIHEEVDSGAKWYLTLLSKELEKMQLSCTLPTWRY